jgi:phospholipid-translocating ATPase
MLLMMTPNPDGLVFVDTANLDGETNLKDKAVPIPKLTVESALEMNGKIFCDAPNHLLEEWDAEMVSAKLKKNAILDIKNLLLRDTMLKNTNFCIGIAINLGKHTKIMMNSKKPKQKVSNIMRTMNYLLYSIFAFQMAIVVTFASLS